MVLRHVVDQLVKPFVPLVAQDGGARPGSGRRPARWAGDRTGSDAAVAACPQDGQTAVAGHPVEPGAEALIGQPIARGHAGHHVLGRVLCIMQAAQVGLAESHNRFLVPRHQLTACLRIPAARAAQKLIIIIFGRPCDVAW